MLITSNYTNRTNYKNTLKTTPAKANQKMTFGCEFPKTKSEKAVYYTLHGIMAAAWLGTASAIGYVGYFAAQVGNEAHRLIVRIPKAEQKISSKVKDFNAAHKIFDNAEAIGQHELRKDMNSLRVEFRSDEERYLKQVQDSLDGKKVTPNTTYAAKIKDGKALIDADAKQDSINAKIQVKADSIRAQAKILNAKADSIESLERIQK